MSSLRHRSPFTLAIGVWLSGCATHAVREVAPRPASDSAPPRPAPVIGLADDDDYVVRIVSGEVTCSGTLVDDDLVLTAHHCVSGRDEKGGFVTRDVPPAALRIELGGDDLPWGEVGVKAIVSPPCGHAAGQGDIAVLVLERPLVGLPTLSPRLDHAPDVGERIEPMGFGRCALSDDGIRRRARLGGVIDAVRPDRFRLNASICPGDSGGPALTPDGELIGVISTAVMDGSERTLGRAEFTRLDHWRPVFALAKQIAGGASAAELPPLAGCPELPR